MLWDIDYVGMDYSEDQEINVRYLHPSAAFTQDGENVRTALLNKDDRYLEQLKSGDEAMISFATDMYRDANEQFSYVLHSRGYYQHVRDYSGSPEITSLLRFKIPGRFSHFSKEKYDEMSLLLQTAEISASVK